MSEHSDFTDFRLETIGQGAIPQLFNEVLQDVLEDIDDPNKGVELERSITIVVKFKPGKVRARADVTYTVDPKLAKATTRVTEVYIARGKNGKMEASEFNLNQMDIREAIAETERREGSGR